MLDVNCKDCRYRYWLTKYGGHVWGEDCDEYGTDLCKKMNDPGFAEFVKNGGLTDGKEKCAV